MILTTETGIEFKIDNRANLYLPYDNFRVQPTSGSTVQSYINFIEKNFSDKEMFSFDSLVDKIRNSEYVSDNKALELELKKQHPNIVNVVKKLDDQLNRYEKKGSGIIMLGIQGGKKVKEPSVYFGTGGYGKGAVVNERKIINSLPKDKIIDEMLREPLERIIEELDFKYEFYEEQHDYIPKEELRKSEFLYELNEILDNMIEKIIDFNHYEKVLFSEIEEKERENFNKGLGRYLKTFALIQ